MSFLRSHHRPPTVTLVGTDSADVTFPCSAGQVITDAAGAAGYRPRVVCARGGCGACRAVVLEGQIEHRGGVSAVRLRGSEPGHPGYVLLCRAIPLGDVVLRPENGWVRRMVRPWSARLRSVPEQSRHAPGKAPDSATEGTPMARIRKEPDPWL